MVEDEVGGGHPIYNRVLLRNWNKEPKSIFFRDWGRPGDSPDTATASGMSLWLLRTFLGTVAIDSGRHGRERGFFRSKMSGGSEDSFFGTSVQYCTIVVSKHPNRSKS